MAANDRGAGRPKGSRNKGPKRAQYGVLAIAKEVLPAMGRAAPGKRLGKEVLEEFMMIARGMAARYQPAPPGQPRNPHQNETKFLTYAEMATKCASDLAQYQSPRFKAIAVEDAVTAAAPGSPAEDDDILQFPSDPVAASRLYLRFMSAIDGK
jgi:hypothetical protein